MKQQLIILIIIFLITSPLMSQVKTPPVKKETAPAKAQVVQPKAPAKAQAIQPTAPVNTTVAKPIQPTNSVQPASNNYVAQQPLPKKDTRKVQTLIDTDNLSVGGFGALVIKGTKVHNQNSLLVGAKGGIVINHSFSIGIAGYGLPSQVDGLGSYSKYNLGFGYGGLYMEYEALAESAMHISLGVTGGAGGVSLFEKCNFVYDETCADKMKSIEEDAFYFVEPEANLVINVTRWFKMGFGASYRVVRGVNMKGTNNDALSGLAGQVSLRFGKF